MARSPLILLCDHRGEGLSEALQALTTLGYRVNLTESLRQSVLCVEHEVPDVAILDPLARGGVVEIEQLGRGTGEGEVMPLLLVADPGAPMPAILASRNLGTVPWDLIYRSAPFEEYLLRIERLRALAEGLKEMEEVRFLASHDDRTELLRPRPFQERLLEHFSAAGRHRFDLALVLIDLDGFGRVNKDFDHTVGDQVIARVGAVIRNHLRAEDVGARLGGDEFAVLLPYTRKIATARVVSRMREDIHALSGPVEGREGELVVSASLGFETYDGTDLETVESLRIHAELALKSAKDFGGNHALYFRNLPSVDSGRSAK